MKCTIPEISWHNRDPVLALDIQPNPSDGIYRLATAGTDTHVLVWQLRILDNGGISVEALSDLTRHNRAVNAVRFSPDGETLATADDEAAIILWKKQDSGETDIFGDDPEKENKENWVIFKMLRGHLEDVYDICWSKDSQFLISGSVDNSAILWDISKGKHTSILKEHKGFVQGVAWDPINQYVATLCSDRCCRVYNLGTKKLSYKIDKAMLPMTDAEDIVTEKQTRLFYDDTLKSFCRRLGFSPDGEILLTPSGILEEENGKTTNVTYVFSRYNFSKPALYLPTKDKYTLAVRFCPVLYELKPLVKEENLKEEKTEEMQKTDEDNEKVDSSEDWRNYANLLNLPYRMIFAVATQNALFLYDTQQQVPFAKISNMHYTRLSDIAWSSDGRILVVSSTDGYCSLVSFSEGELGTPYKKDEVTPHKTSSPTATTQKEDVEMSSADSPNLDAKKSSTTKSPKNQNLPSKPSAPQPIAVKRASDSNKVGKRISLVTLSGSSNKSGEDTSTNKTEALDVSSKMQEEAMDVEKKKNEDVVSPPKTVPDQSPAKTPTRSAKTPRHVSLITLSSPKSKKNILGKELTEVGNEGENKNPTKTGNEGGSPAKLTPRRVPFTTVSSPKEKKISKKEMEVDEEVKKRFEGESPAKTVKDASPAKTPTGSSKTPRRVPLVTLSSPKGKKNLGGDSR